MNQKQKDVNFGKVMEDNLFEKHKSIIESKFKDNISRTSSKFCKYDFEGNKYVYELKSRNNEFSKYPTTMIAEDKIIKGSNKGQVFLFNFTDGLYYIKFRETTFKDFEIKPFRRYRTGAFDIEKNYIYIPINKLKKIC